MRTPISLLVVRHGESDANESSVISDRNVDHQLTKVGVQQAKDTANRLKHKDIDLILTSTRQRARKTAEIINEYHGVAIVERKELVERDFGVIGGITLTEAQTRMQTDGFTWLNIPEGESADEIDCRVLRVLDFLRENHRAKTLLISTHSDIVKSFHRLLNGVSAENSMGIEIGHSDPHHFKFE